MNGRDRYPPLCAAIDVDMTVTQGMEQKWWDWMFLKLGYIPEEYPSNRITLDYDLSQEVRDLGYSIKDLNAAEFWKQRNLYDEGIVPQKGSVEALEWLKSQGIKVCFVTHVEGDHAKSKIEWCRKHYPFMDAFIPTREKWYGLPFLIIDDRNKHLNSCSYLPIENIFLRHTKFRQEVELEKGIEFKDWTQFVSICSGDYIQHRWDILKHKIGQLYC